MQQGSNNKIKVQGQINEEIAENLIALLGQLVGVEVTPIKEFKRLNSQKLQLEKNVASLSELNEKYAEFICKLFPYINYRNKWSKLTKSIEVRTKKLNKQNLNIPDNISPEMKKNLSEALSCYVMNLKMASYIMILRSIEIGITELYEKDNPLKFDENKGKNIHVTTKMKLDWIERNKILKGVAYRIAKSFIEGRNEAIHEVYEPSDLQIFSSLEIVIDIVRKLQLKGNL